MEMNQFIYEKSVSYRGHLIIPFVFAMADGKAIYSYALLSELGHKGKFHKFQNPAGLYSNSIEGIVEIAKEHLDNHSDVSNKADAFKCRYTYHNNLIIIHELAGKYFYDHYKPSSLNNVAAPKIFVNEFECINWIKQGLDRSQSQSISEV